MQWFGCFIETRATIKNWKKKVFVGVESKTTHLQAQNKKKMRTGNIITEIVFSWKKLFVRVILVAAINVFIIFKWIKIQLFSLLLLSQYDFFLFQRSYFGMHMNSRKTFTIQHTKFIHNGNLLRLLLLLTFYISSTESQFKF